jgi:2-C-methyl-D-erythritol 4-phosphate cytidylyltransferase
MSDDGLMPTAKNVSAIILASGSGSRTGLDIPKQFLKIAGRPVLEHTLRTFIQCQELKSIIVVSNPLFLDKTKEIAEKIPDDRIVVIEGDAHTRQGSSRRGIEACPDASHVIIHDAVRPLLPLDVINRLIVELDDYDAIDVCIPASDTIVARNGDQIAHIPPRADMMLGQTPQAFKRSLILHAHEDAEAAGYAAVTDDCGLVLRLNEPVHISLGTRANMKITHLDDVYLVERLFQVARSAPGELGAAARLNMRSSLVIGGTKGLGASLVRLMESEGIETLVAGRNTSPAIDVMNPDSIKEYISIISNSGKRYDSIVYAPGLLISKNISEYSQKEWNDTFSVNITGVFNILQHLCSVLTENGQFLALGSSSYSLGRPGYAAYSASKAALINLIQAAAAEIPQYRLNVASPQRANTELRTQAFGVEPDGSLLNPDYVARQILDLLALNVSGMNFDIRVDAPLFRGRTHD